MWKSFKINISEQADVHTGTHNELAPQLGLSVSTLNTAVKKLG
jgi:DNA-binding MurR/RpiR family transcriptional regulator